MLTISREADYAVRIMIHMASSPQKRYQAKALAKDEHIPESFLSKILQMLIKQRVVRSFRGVGGGYQLAADPGRLTLYRLVEMVEGPVGLNACVTGMACDLVTQCAPHDIWVLAQAQLRKTLEGVTIGDLAQSAQRKRARITSFDIADSGDTAAVS